MDNQDNERSKRGIESIAHLFLSQLGNEINDTQASRKPPQRKGPADTEPLQENSSQEKNQPESVIPESLKEIEPENSHIDLNTSLAGEIVLAYHLRDSYTRVCEYASYLSDRDESVVLFSIDEYEISMITDPSGQHLGNAEIIAETEGDISSLIPEINRAGSNNDVLVLNVDPSFSARVNEIISHADCVTIISDCTQDGIIRAYQVLKSVADNIMDDQEIQLFVCDAANDEHADKTFYKFNDTARKFINKVIIPAGFTVLKAEADRPVDDEGITEQEMLELNMAEQVSDKQDPQVSQCQEDAIDEIEQPGDFQEEKPAEEESKNEIAFDAEPVVIETEPSYENSSYDTVSSETVDSNPTDSEQEIIPNIYNGYPGEVDLNAGNKSVEIESDKFNSHNQYKPSRSEDESNVKEIAQKPESSKDDSEAENRDIELGQVSKYRSNVISAPKVTSLYTGPSQLKPVALYSELNSDYGVSSFVSMNYGRLTGCYGAVPIEHRPFTELFPNAQIMIQPSGVPSIFISVVFDIAASELIDEICNWFDENIGIISSRYRTLKIKTDISPELIVISGINHNDIFDEATLIADEHNASCKICQLVQIEINGQKFVSLY